MLVATDPFDLWNGGGIGEVFEVEFDGLLEVGEGFLFGGAEAGYVVAEALGDAVGIFTLESVMDVSYA